MLESGALQLADPWQVTTVGVAYPDPYFRQSAAPKATSPANYITGCAPVRAARLSTLA